MRMNLRQKLFCEYYLGECCGNAEAAAIKAGYTARSARQSAYKLLQNIQIKEYIAQKSSEIITNNIASIQDIQEFWSSVMKDEETRMTERLRASELLAKAKGMFNNDW